VKRLVISLPTRFRRPTLAVGGALLLGGALMLSGCAGGAAATKDDAGGGSSRADHQRQLTDAVDAYVQEHPGLIASVSVRHGDETLDYGTDHRYQTASIVKLEILVRWLMLRQDDKLPHDEYQLAERMITASDNDATSHLCQILAPKTKKDAVPGGTDACVGDSTWGTDLTTADGQRQVLQAAFGTTLLNADSRAVVKKLMGTVEPTQDWGVSAAAADGEKTWLKNGWDIRDNGWITHSDGVVDAADGHLIYLSILTNGNDTEAKGISHVEELATITRDALSLRGRAFQASVADSVGVVDDAPPRGPMVRIG
jgi:hypothetical protein